MSGRGVGPVPVPPAAEEASDLEPGDRVTLVLLPVPDVGTRHTYLEPGDGLLGASVGRRTTKRLVEVAVASVALVILIPVFVCAGLAVVLTSPGPVFYLQQRAGHSGRTFRFIKFRTMYRDADSTRPTLSDSNEMDGPVFKIRDDPRITPVGRVLRKFSIDEMPQLLHVITGAMSLVGPRPPLLDEVEAYGSWERQRLLVKPGITCIWQVSGRSDLDFETWVEMDIDYIRTWTLGLDLVILARTVPAVLFGRGAY